MVILFLFMGGIPSIAYAQSTLLQAGPWTPGHLPQYLSSGNSQATVQDGGGAAGGGLGATISELGLTVRATGTAPFANGGLGPNSTNFCDYDGPITGPNHFLCLSPNAQGGGLISYGFQNGATALPFKFIVNGTSYSFPFTTSGVLGPNSSTVGHIATWNNTTGSLLADGGLALPASAIVGISDSQTLTNKSIAASEINSGTLAAAQMPALTGAVTSSAGSVATTLAAGIVANSNLAAAGSANTVKGAAASTTVTDLAVPSCSTASSALQWTTNTGFGCASISTSAGWGLSLSGTTLSVSQTAPPYGFDVPVNMGLSASVGSSALTINVTGANGLAPSATNPVLVPFRSTTLTNGTPAWTSITAALSIVVPSTATLGTSSSNVPFRVWIFLAYNSGTPELGVALCSIPSPVTIYSCTSWEANRITTTTIAGGSNTAGTLYATTGVSNDAVRIIGYADYSGGLATAGTWASTPTTLQLMGPGIKKPGDVIQSIAPAFGTLTVVTYTSSVTSTNVTASITPTSAVNLIRYAAAVTGANGTVTDGCASQFYRGTTAIGAVSKTFSSNTSAAYSNPFVGYDAPQTSSSTTYLVKGNTNIGGGTCSIPAVNTDSATEVLEEIMG